MKNGCTVTTLILLVAMLVFGVFASFTDDGKLIDLDACNNFEVDDGSYFYENEFECESIDLIFWFLLPAWCVIFVGWLLTRIFSKYQTRTKS